jgi:hypothetical protein
VDLQAAPAWQEELMRRNILSIIVAGLTWGVAVLAQQVPDRNFQPSVASPAYERGQGPTVCLDEAHANFHTLDERFWAFGELLRRDGYVVRANTATFERGSLDGCSILVIANAQPGLGSWNDYPYPTPSAFTGEEVNTIRLWVGDGGRLLLIADHMPLAGAAARLAAAFGVTFTDGFAVEAFATEAEREAALAKATIFRTTDQTLRPHPIVQGRNAQETVTAIRKFTGQAFEAPRAAEPLLVVPSTFILLMPRAAWQFGPDTTRMSVGGWLQGAAMRVESGRAAFFGEAAMFSAQLGGADRRPVGMNAPGAEQNAQFVLNVMHWLSGVL